MKQAHIKLLLIILILAIATLACVGGGGARGSNGQTASSARIQATQSAYATATYGAEQFELQLTARAQPGNPSP